MSQTTTWCQPWQSVVPPTSWRAPSQETRSSTCSLRLLRPLQQLVLKKNLLKGPKQLNSIIGVLTRFRKEDAALKCDIEQTFHSFHVRPSHRDFLHLLRFDNNDLDGAMSEFRLNVHLYGAVSSPTVVNYILHKTAETGSAEFGDKAADFLCRNFSVEDGLTSVSTISEAIELIDHSQAHCVSVKLRLHKFASNRKDFLEALPKVDCEETSKTLIFATMLYQSSDL